MKTKDFSSEKQQIEQLHKEIDKITAPLWKKIHRLEAKIKTCEHPISYVLQGKWKPNDAVYFNNGEPEFRVCTICGYAEEGWGCGFQKLGQHLYSEIKEVSREEAQKYVKKMHYQRNISEWGNHYT